MPGEGEAGGLHGKETGVLSGHWPEGRKAGRNGKVM